MGLQIGRGLHSNMFHGESTKIQSPFFISPRHTDVLASTFSFLVPFRVLNRKLLKIILQTDRKNIKSAAQDKMTLHWVFYVAPQRVWKTTDGCWWLQTEETQTDAVSEKMCVGVFDVGIFCTERQVHACMNSCISIHTFCLKDFVFWKGTRLKPRLLLDCKSKIGSTFKVIFTVAKFLD